MLAQRGISLVELMISMTLGFVALSAMSSLVAQGIVLNTSFLAKSRLDEEVNAVLAIISQDLKRIGFHGLTHKMIADPENFTSPFQRTLTVAKFPQEPAKSCVTFAYDANQNGLLDAKYPNENYGYRLRDEAIEIRMNSLECKNMGWHDITDSSIVKVTMLSFIQEKHISQQISHSRIHISLQAKLTKQPQISRYASASILIQNYD
jgi:prepilin peptidase dependent protein B